MLESPHFEISFVNDMERLDEVSFDRSSSTEAAVVGNEQKAMGSQNCTNSRRIMMDV